VGGALRDRRWSVLAGLEDAGYHLAEAGQVGLLGPAEDERDADAVAEQDRDAPVLAAAPEREHDRVQAHLALDEVVEPLAGDGPVVEARAQPQPPQVQEAADALA